MSAALCVFFVVLGAPLAVHADTVHYEVVFEGVWDASHVTLPFPSGAHLTTLIGDTHVQGAVFWAEDELASPGVEGVAETGATAVLASEIASRIAAEVSGEEVRVPGIFGFPGETSAVFSVALERPEISLVSMVAPTPDWFVGVSGLSLRDELGWIPEISVDLMPYDAGTETGNGFWLSNPASDPHEVIRQRGAPFAEEAVVARLHFTRVPEPGVIVSVLAVLATLAWYRRALLATRSRALDATGDFPAGPVASQRHSQPSIWYTSAT
jgi:hypothetical protein